MRSLLEFFFSAALLIDHGQATRDFRHFQRSHNASDASPSLSTAGQPSRSSHNATSLPEDGSCGDVWMSWLNSSTRYIPTWTSYLDTYTYHNITAATTTLCDGHPRVAGGSGGLTTVATGTNSTLTSAPKNFTLPTPTCRLSTSECTGELATYSLCSGAPTTSSSDCGACSIWGGTVQLNYFPITRNATGKLCQTAGDGSPTLCPLAPTGTPYSVANPFGMTPCDYITDNVTSTRNSGSYLVSDGQTYYQNRVYISLDTIYASNSCGYVGKQYAGTTLTLASKDVYSVHGYHHEFNDVGYQFDFADLSSVPADKYYANCGGGQDPICVYSGTNYRYGTDFINGRSDIDFGVGYAVGDGHTETGYQWIWQGAYSPTLLVPLQIRTLDPAWATCSLNLVGFYDPPKPLTGQLTYPTPTTPTVPKTSEAAPAATATNDGAPATADPKPTSNEQPTAQYTSTTYTYNPAPTSTAGASADSPDNEGADPTSNPLGAPHETQQETNDPAPAPTDGSPSGSSPESAGPSDPQTSPETPPPSGDPPPSDPATPVLSTPPSSANTQPLDPESPVQSPPQPPATADPGPTQSPQDADSQPSTDMPDDGDHSAPAVSTTNAIGGVIASIFGAQPAPTTTINALSVLESATQTYDGGQGAPTGSVPHGESPLPSSPPTPDPQAQPPQPITLSEGEQTHTIEPLTGSGEQGVYTIVAPEPGYSAPGAESASYTSDALPTQPVILTGADYTQTVQPVQGSSGLYTVIGPDPTNPTAVDPAPTTGFSPEAGGSEAAESSQLVATGPATFVAGGQTHTISPLQSSSGVFVVDGSRTLTQLMPSNTADSAGSGISGSEGSGTASNEQTESILASASGSLPAVVTATNDSPSASSTAAGGGGGGGNGNADVTVFTPPESGVQSSRVVSSVLAWTCLLPILMYT